MLGTSEHIHFIGIGGYGMSGIAKVMLEMGYDVSGSDVASRDITDKLKKSGAKVFIGHQQSNIDGADTIVYSSAIPKDNVELQAALGSGLPMLHRSDMLAKLLNERKGIAVAGAHGKTTTSSMIALVMELSGLDPTYLIGGEIMNMGNNAKAGRGEYVVAEADESDRSFLKYRPSYAVVTNIEADHLENYDGSFDNLKSAYYQFLNQVKDDGTAVICMDDVYLREMAGHIPTHVISYGIDQEAEYMAQNVTLFNRGSSFDVVHDGTLLGSVTLSVPGKHNIYNAMATIIVCLQSGLTLDQIASVLKQFHGAKRRFQVLGEKDGMMVIDDYAHHPTEIEATIAAAKSSEKRIVAVFQPQRYTRTFFLLDAFSRAFHEADEVIITDIFAPAGEKQIEGVSSERLTELIKQNSNQNTRYIATKDDVKDYLLSHLEPNDLVLTMGAGDIWTVAKDIAAKWNEEKR